MVHSITTLFPIKFAQQIELNKKQFTFDPYIILECVPTSQQPPLKGTIAKCVQFRLPQSFNIKDKAYVNRRNQHMIKQTKKLSKSKL